MNEAGPSPNTIYKNELKMDYRPKYKTEHYKTHRRKHGQNFMTQDLAIIS